MRSTLSFAKPLELQRARVPVEPLLAEVCDQFAPEAAEQGVALERHAEVTCPPILGDQGHLADALTNLVRNALDELPSGGRVRLSARESDDWVELTVDDDGPGIPTSMAERLFDAFMTSKSDGTGIGLALCRKVFEEHGGSIEVGVSPLGGARFVVQLPAATQGHPALR